MQVPRLFYWLLTKIFLSTYDLSDSTINGIHGISIEFMYFSMSPGSVDHFSLHLVMPITRITTCIPFPLCCPELMRKGTKAEDELRFLNGGQS